ncbi:MAG: hypothetical protein CL766_06135 [Chloroflexi bacterium]|jgi:hypothetical protein|nr:hypothetical protein [Chloroflexota bacterium]|tara:strand:- start:343 stop:576 length:234 start_codon:yes stop_codon:yes gene_type:complete
MNINIGSVQKIPTQFLIVFIISAIITVYLGASVAEKRIESRNTNNNISLLNNPYSQFSDDIEAEFWENGFLWACPLH